MAEITHTPALLKEAVDCLRVQPGAKYIDCTLGLGGHTREILRRGGQVLGLDVDAEALAIVREELAEELAAGQLTLVKTNFADLERVAQEHDFQPVAGILYDLGLSSLHLDKAERGFSWRFPGAPLDMRMDQDLAVTAADLLHGLSEEELTRLFFRLGEEKFAKRIARRIVEDRRSHPITTGDALAELVTSAYPPPDRHGRIHPATRVFQALRIAVNTELDNLRVSLPRAVRLLKPSGRLVIISFHSLEDVIAKNLGERPFPLGKVRAVIKKPLRPSEEEKAANPRARSARLRVYERV